MTLRSTLNIQLPSPLERFTPDWEGADDVELWIKRDDMIHPVISGNKWRKLESVLSGHSTPAKIVSFGGAYSNHLHALGYCCYKLDIPFTAIVRGHPDSPLTPMLEDLINWRTEIQFVNRITYRLRDTHDYLTQLAITHPGALIVPEGGSQQAAIGSVAALLSELPDTFDIITAPVASGATLAGIVSGLQPHQRAEGIAVLKGKDYLESLVNRFFRVTYDNWVIHHQFHHGGYGKTSHELNDVCRQMAQKHRIAVEPVYSGKVFFAVKSLLAAGHYPKGSRIVIVHTGGLQGAR